MSSKKPFMFHDHYELRDKHAYLSASKYHWLRYDEDKLRQSYLNHLAVLKGTRLHAFAAEAIDLKEKLARSKNTLNTYVNDAISYRMRTEQPLYYSENCFGTADAICFRNNKLRIHDLKTGVTPAHMEQLMIYAALFCLEYHIKPIDISIELRIYQSNEVNVYEPTAEEIIDIMDKIKSSDAVIMDLLSEEDY